MGTEGSFLDEHVVKSEINRRLNNATQHVQKDLRFNGFEALDKDERRFFRMAYELGFRNGAQYTIENLMEQDND